MRVALRTTLSALVVAAAAGAAATVPSFVPFIALAGTTVLIMGGTGHPLSAPPDTLSYVHQYMDMAADNFVSPSSKAAASTGIPEGPYNRVAVITPEEDAPNYGTLTLRQSVAQGMAALDSCVTSIACDYNQDVGSAAPSPSDSFVVFGYSQSASIAMLEKARLAAEYAKGEGPDVSFVVIAAARPNGGLVARDTDGIVMSLLFGHQRDELITDPAPTDTQYSTVDIALQYDGFSDFPLNPLNLLASINAYLGVTLLHQTYEDHELGEPGVVDQGQHGDTHYYLITADVLPLLTPMANIPFIGRPLADLLDPVLRVIVESAYDRSTSPGVPTPFDVSYSEGPAKLAADIRMAIPTGVDNGIEDIFGVRLLGTERPGAYGIGGSDTVSAPPNSTAISSARSTAASDVSTGINPESDSTSEDTDDSPSLDSSSPGADSTDSDSTNTSGPISTSTSESSIDSTAETSESAEGSSSAGSSESRSSGSRSATPSRRDLGAAQKSERSASPVDQRRPRTVASSSS